MASLFTAQFGFQRGLHSFKGKIRPTVSSQRIPDRAGLFQDKIGKQKYRRESSWLSSPSPFGSMMLLSCGMLIRKNLHVIGISSRGLLKYPRLLEGLGGMTRTSEEQVLVEKMNFKHGKFGPLWIEAQISSYRFLLTEGTNPTHPCINHIKHMFHAEL